MTASNSGMNLHLKRLLTAVCLALAVQTHLRAQTQTAMLTTDTLQLTFQKDSIHIDMAYDGNDSRWAAFEESFKRQHAGKSPAALRLDIYTGGAPEGTAAYNRWLGENRGQAIRRMVQQRLGRSIGTIDLHNEGARWYDLYDRVAANREPWRDEVLAIIELPASTSENRRDHREIKLREPQR